MATTSVGKLRSKREAAHQLGISIATLDRLIAAGRIEYFKVGWHVRFSEAQINAYLDSTLNASRARETAGRKTVRQRAA